MKICMGTVARNRPDRVRALLQSHSGTAAAEGTDICVVDASRGSRYKNVTGR